MTADLDDLPENELSDEFRRGVAFAELCHRQAETDRAEAMALALGGTGVAVVSWPRLVAALAHRCIAAGLACDAALAEARREAAWLVLTARATPAGAAMAALDRVADAVDALAGERDALRDRIARAVAELDAAPDADPEKPSKRAMREVLHAAARAAAMLRDGDADLAGEGCSPPTSPAGDTL